MNVLAVGAHFDDVELGCAGTLANHHRRGDNTWIYVASHSGYCDPAGVEVRSAEVAKSEGTEAAEILGATLLCGSGNTNHLLFSDELICQILKIVEDNHIDTLYTHWQHDVHQDHQAVALSSVVAGKRVDRILAYRSNFYDSGQPFTGAFFVDISDSVDIKRRAIMAHRSEIDRVQGKWLEMFGKKGEIDGYRVGVPAAEVFEVVKYLAPR